VIFGLVYLTFFPPEKQDNHHPVIRDAIVIHPAGSQVRLLSQPADPLPHRGSVGLAGCRFSPTVCSSGMGQDVIGPCEQASVERLPRCADKSHGSPGRQRKARTLWSANKCGLPASPSEFMESGVIDAEVVPDLVDEGSAHLLDNLDVGAAAGCCTVALVSRNRSLARHETRCL
jgi:hypothetical protein